MSKAFYKSTKTPNVYFFLSSDVQISSIKSNNAYEVDNEDRNPFGDLTKKFNKFL